MRIEVPMAERFLEEQEQLITLTHEQALLLHRLARQRRMVVTGPAGSGKTVLAIERAERLAEKGKRVLFICFNRALRDHLRKTKRSTNLLINNFHSACVALAKPAEIPLSIDDGSEPTADYWQEELPMALMSAVDKLGKQYDALFVDEAQDLDEDWFDALTYTLKDPDDSYIWLFMDDNQRVYDANLTVPEGFQTWDLTVNCRNTQAIHREVMKKYEGDVEPEAIGPEGRELEYYETNDPAEVITARIAALCGAEEVPPQDIVVLSSHGIEKSTVAKAGCGKFTYTKEPKPVGPYIRFSSIRAFKGLESPVVILCELEDIEDETIDQQLYVGFSRARNHCLVVAPES
jgi:superfamily I DNA/RNA helicase